MNRAMNIDVMPTPVITIDGPSGSGKGTLSVLLAERLGWHLLDSGAMYRVLGYAIELHQLWDASEDAWAKLAKDLELSFELVDGHSHAFYQGKDIERLIRTEEGAARASRVAVVDQVRTALLARQKDFAQAPGLVADGRDMGTVVFPDAGLKIFLTASAEARAERRYLQLKNKGESVSLPALLQDIQIRDERDSNRFVAPLKPAEDAIQIDSTIMSIEEVLAQVLELSQEREISR